MTRHTAIVIETLAVLGGIATFISAKTVQPYMLLGVGLLAASFAIRYLAGGYLARRTLLDWPLLLFVLSALVGVWAAYDQPVAWVKFLHILGGVALYYLLASRGNVSWFAMATVLALSFFGAALAVAFVTQFDYAAQPGKFAVITRLGAAVTSLSPQFGLRLPHPNLVAGTLALIAPLSVAAAAGVRRPALRLLVLLCAGCILGGLLMTTSRGAWLGVAAVGLAALAAGWAGRRVPLHRQPALERGSPGGRLERGSPGGRLLLVVAAVAAAGTLALLVGCLQPAAAGWPDLLARALGGFAGGERVLSRAELYGQGWRLINDALFTGSGLGMFGMVYSTYVLLDWVHFLSHAHNVFLEVWIEQGVLGFAAFVWMIAAFYTFAWRRRTHLTWLGWGCLAATSVMLLHGMVDNTIYSFRVLPLLFVPLGLIMPCSGEKKANVRPPILGRAGPAGERPAGERPAGERGTGGTGGTGGAGMLVGLALAVAVVLLARNQLAALWYANLGSVAQGKAELRDYAFPQRLADDVRRAGDLSAAERSLQQALAHAPSNRTARQRLALIALGRSGHEQALSYLEPAGELAAGDGVSQQLLCEALLGLGRLDDAYRACAPLPGAAIRLQGVAAVRYDRINDVQRAAWARALAERLLAERSLTK